jgi:hypothetical protein
LNSAKIFLFIYNYIYPFIGFPLFLWLWAQVGNPAFAALAMGLPFVFGYLIPGIATNHLKLWRFHGHLMVGDYFVHHGLIYASTMGLALYLGFLPAAGTGTGALLANMARTAAVIGFGGWGHDLLAVRHGLIEIYNGAWKRGASPKAIVSHSTPLVYALLGASYAAIASLGYQVLVVQDGSIHNLWWLFPLGLAVMTVVSSVPYLLMEPR